ncbi:hypothetical protein KJ660_00395, partial [Candidatus Micrarchaeota archaeon]|nr:hypothetical protein [Candidatus Micrarchaeota archaeon]
GVIITIMRKKFPGQWHINWLIVMIFGGAIALAVEHIAHQEIVPWPPFLTAMSTAADTTAMIGEMATVGIPMTVALVLGWIAIVVAYEKATALRTVPMTASEA